MMQRFWLTTHWPPLKGARPHTYYVYLQHEFGDLAQTLLPGDRVLFYELVTGRPRVESRPDGTKSVVKRERGRGGVIGLGTVSGGRRPFSWPAEAVQSYADGTTMNWAWEVPVDGHDYSGFVDRRHVVRVLGYKPKYNMRGFGIGGSGLKELDKRQFDELASLFEASPRD